MERKDPIHESSMDAVWPTKEWWGPEGRGGLHAAVCRPACFWRAVRAGDESARAARKGTGASPAFIDKLIEEGWKKAAIKPAEAAVGR